MPEKTRTPPPTGSNDAPVRFAEDDFFRALSSRERRRSLAYLLGADHCSVEELADVLCGWETMETEMVAPDCVEKVSVELFHVHLPILEEAGLIEYDVSAKTVSLEPLAEPVRKVILQSVEAECN